MPPPFQQNTGSKAALVTWTVITSILFVVATVLAIFAYLDRNQISTQLDTLTQRSSRVMSESEYNGDLKTQLEAAAQADPENIPSGSTLVKVATLQRDALARTLAGAGTKSPQAALIDGKAALAAAQEKAKVQGDNLATVTNTLINNLISSQNQVRQLELARDGLNKKIESITSTFTQQLAAKDKDIEAARAQAGTYQSEVTGVRSDKDKQIQDIQANAEGQTRLAQEDVNRLQAQLSEAAVNARKQEQVIQGLQGKLRDIRVSGDQISRQADARILRVGTDGTVYIDLGTGDQVTAGLSFEVYDRIEGIPKIGDPNNDENLPEGKASIEIVKVQPGASQARIVRSVPGAQIVEGDLCANIVYDRNIKYNFVVYGNFDLDRNGQATPTDADVIKRLVTNWGGNVVDKINVDTDFLVIGKVPEVPNYTQEELDRPEIQFEVERRRQELAAYDEVLAQAAQLNIPVLNQNRFLYFSGYYEQSAR